MKNLRDLSHLQIKTDLEYKDGGVFMLPCKDVTLRIIATTSYGWDHVSASLPNRCPTWEEMQLVHRTFFKERETAWEYHVRPSDHISIHPYTLHLWRKQNFKMPMPPTKFV